MAPASLPIWSVGQSVALKKLKGQISRALGDRIALLPLSHIWQTAARSERGVLRRRDETKEASKEQQSRSVRRP